MGLTAISLSNSISKPVLPNKDNYITVKMFKNCFKAILLEKGWNLKKFSKQLFSQIPLGDLTVFVNNHINYQRSIIILFDYQRSGISWIKKKEYLLRHKNRNTQKVIPSLQLHISHLIRSYSSVQAIRGSSYTVLRYVSFKANWGNWAQIRPNHVQGHTKKIQSLQLHLL